MPITRSGATLPPWRCAGLPAPCRLCHLSRSTWMRQRRVHSLWAMASSPEQIIQATPAWAEVMAAVHAAAFPPAEAWDADAFRAQLDLPGVIGMMHREGGLILIRI